MACHLCHNLSTAEPESGIFGSRRQGRSIPILPQNLRDAAATGCHSCRLLLNGLTEFVPGNELCDITDLYAVSIVSDGSREMLRLRAIKRNNKQTSLVFYAKSKRVNAIWPLLTVASHVSADSSSPDCLGQASKWLSSCLKHHDCGRSVGTSEAVLPTRLIHVGEHGSAPHLYEPALGTKGAYVALSYCWGKGRTCLTTKASYSKHKIGFELDEMPKTCRDAVVATRSLGYEYLWIDQLCIVQDDDDDWKREARKMASIYQNAIVTLVGLDSPSSDMGLFLGSPGRRTTSIDVKLPDSSVDVVYARLDSPRASQGIIHRIPGELPGTTNDILTTRGWTLQEVTLSPRILWFTSSEMAWTCLGWTACECTPLMTGEWNEGSASGIMQPRQKIYNGVGNITWEKFWRELVVGFTERNFTVPADRLPALAGLATAFQNQVDDKYMCGLWKNRLATQLLWTSFPDEDFLMGDRVLSPGESVPPDYGPSWSWCSVSGQVWFLSTAERSDFVLCWNVISVAYESDVATPAQGEITLEAHIMSLKFADNAFVVSLNGSAPSFANLDYFIPDQRPTYEGVKSLGNAELSFLQAGYLRRTDRNGQVTGTDICSGLVLQPVANDHTGTRFRRVGIIETHLKASDAVGNWDSWQKLCEKRTVILV